MKITKKHLVSVAKELDKIMRLEPPIETGRKITKAKLESDIREASGELMPADKLTTDTALVLAELGVTIQPKKPDQPEPKLKPGQRPDNGMKVPEPPKRYTRMAAVTDALKSARKPLSKAEWTERADRLYTSHGGKSNLNETRWSLNYVIAVLAGLDIAIETDKGFQLKG